MPQPNVPNWPRRLVAAFQPWRAHFGMESEVQLGVTGLPILVRVVDKHTRVEAYFQLQRKDLEQLGAAAILNGIMTAVREHLRRAQGVAYGNLSRN